MLSGAHCEDPVQFAYPFSSSVRVLWLSAQVCCERRCDAYSPVCLFPFVWRDGEVGSKASYMRCLCRSQNRGRLSWKSEYITTFRMWKSHPKSHPLGSALSSFPRNFLFMSTKHVIFPTYHYQRYLLVWVCFTFRHLYVDSKKRRQRRKNREHTKLQH